VVCRCPPQRPLIPLFSRTVGRRITAKRPKVSQERIVTESMCKERSLRAEHQNIIRDGTATSRFSSQPRIFVRTSLSFNKMSVEGGRRESCPTQRRWYAEFWNSDRKRSLRNMGLKIVRKSSVRFRPIVGRSEKLKPATAPVRRFRFSTTRVPDETPPHGVTTPTRKS